MMMWFPSGVVRRLLTRLAWHVQWIDVKKEEIKDGREGDGGKIKYRAREQERERKEKGI